MKGFLLFLLVLAMPALSSVIEVPAQVHSLRLAEGLQYLHVRRDSHTLPDASESWEVSGGTLAFGFDKTPLWVRFELKNTAPQARHLVLEIANPLLDQVDVWTGTAEHSSLLASAGIGGIILGFAAKPVLGNLLAGMQIALTQPFRIDDVLHVQGEWCWVEEVTATYVVLRVWDLRRLVVPLQWFIENPFQNWSRNDTEMMGTVFITVDYSMPIEPLRTEFERLLEQAPDWDGKTKIVQVTEAGEANIEVRFLLSARDSSSLWNLRCAIREGLITFIQAQFPAHLPRVRARLVETPDQ